MTDQWKCRKCYGTGEIIRGLADQHIIKCPDCDGTGNALVDGPTERHKRELARIKRKQMGLAP